ncbi:MAG: hypothetical protein HQL69_16950, partial [Magnetococcales bacterium]|nr:hypothetical protein [Magnetococcales bacterium]
MWLSDKKHLYHLNPAGEEKIKLHNGKSHHNQIESMVTDPADNTLWAATKDGILQVVQDGSIQQNWDIATKHQNRNFSKHISSMAIYVDLLPPFLEIVTPKNDSYINSNTPTFELNFDDISGVDVESLVMMVGENLLPVTCVEHETGASCTASSPLEDGRVSVAISIEDYAGNRTDGVLVEFSVDTTQPVITVNQPTDGSYNNEPQQTISGFISETASLAIKGQSVDVSEDNSFSHDITLVEGINQISFWAKDLAGNQTDILLNIILDTQPPATPQVEVITIGEVIDGFSTVTGDQGSVEAGAKITITNNRTGESVEVTANTNGSFTANLTAEPGDTFTILLQDQAGNSSEPIDALVPIEDGLPPNPATIAPPLNQTSSNTIGETTAFLYSGENPIQTDVAPDTIKATRAAVIRGQVNDIDGNPLSGVQITVGGHPEYGQTLSRSDGGLDMAVNGGGLLTVRFEKEGYIPVDRQIKPGWQSWGQLPDVVLTPLDENVATIDLAASQEMQLAQGSVIADEDGQRQATLLFPAQTQATMLLPDGTSQPLNTINVRATEFTVGPNGKKAMPAKLPPNSGYTYAVELSVDEAIAAGATEVRFSKAVPVYVDNFLNFPVGGAVPVGYYDRKRMVWVPSDNGRVIKVIAVTDDGLAQLDIDGSNTPASAAALAALGVSDDELQKIATIYQPGKSLWRVFVTHFTPWDFNWPFAPPADSTPPTPGTTGLNSPTPTDPDVANPECQGGSIIECQTQTLGEVLPVTGTPFDLHYRSDRFAGRTAALKMTVPISWETIPASLKKIDLHIRVAGRSFKKQFAATANQSYNFVWDGLDGYGRPVQGKADVAVDLGYVYQAVYTQPADFRRSFANSSGVPITNSKSRQEITMWRKWTTQLGHPPSRKDDFGGWTLSEHHLYDVASKTLYRGDGVKRRAKDIKHIITTVAGNDQGQEHSSMTSSGPATEAPLSYMGGIDFAADGSMYISFFNDGVVKVNPEGIISRFTKRFLGYNVVDGRPAIEASLGATDVAVAADGSVYIADIMRHRVKRVDPDGIITTFAGIGVAGTSGDGGPANQAMIHKPVSVIAADDGSIYIACEGSKRIRKVSTDGTISTFAGNGYAYYGDGAQASIRGIGYPKDIALAPNGDLYFTNNRHVRKVGVDGIMNTIAGDIAGSRAGDNLPAKEINLDFIHGIDIAGDGTYYLSHKYYNLISQIDQEGIFTFIAGNGAKGFSGDGGIARNASFNHVTDVALSPDGDLYIADNLNYRVRRVGLAISGFTNNEIAIPSKDGSLVFRFDKNGRHLSTLNSYTGALVYQFIYNDDGRLIQVVDGDGDTTNIERQQDGTAIAITSAYGLRSELLLNDDGYLASISNPAAETYNIAYTPDGLLTQFTNPRGFTSTITYDEHGFLQRDENPAGGSWQLSRRTFSNGFHSLLTSAMNRTTTYKIENHTQDGWVRYNIAPDGTISASLRSPNGDITNVPPDGTVTVIREKADPRFGMQAPIPAGYMTVTTPSGLVKNILNNRVVEMGNKNDPLSLTHLNDQIIVNGQSFTTNYDASSKVFTKISPSNRRSSTFIDDQGRTIKQSMPELASTNYSYDTRGRLTTISSGTGDAQRNSSFSYDTQGNLNTITDALGRVTDFSYDNVGRVVKALLPNSREILFSYDANGNRTSITPPNRLAHQSTYNPVDLESTYQPPGLGDNINVATTYDYNLDKDLTTITRPDGQQINFLYNNGGRVTAQTIPRGQYQYAYHAKSGKLATLTAPDSGTITYSYDGPLLLSSTWDGAIKGSVTRTYNNDFNIISRGVNGS